MAKNGHQLRHILREIGHDEFEGVSAGPLMKGIELLSQPFSSIGSALPLALGTGIFHAQKYTAIEG